MAINNQWDRYLNSDKTLDDILNLNDINKYDLNKFKRIEEQKAKIRAQVEKKYNQKGIKDRETLELEAQKRIQKYIQKLNKETLNDKKKQYDEEYKYASSLNQKLASGIKSIAAGTAQAIGKGLGSSLNSISKGIDSYISTYSSYMSNIEARLQGSGKSFESITNLISSNVGASQYVSQSEILKNLSTLVEKGIAYNVEQRAFLQTVSDDIARTFDAANGTLLQLIRIQQADSTAARLGLEAQLTQFFNQTFGDTSYLSDLFDTVSANILGANALLGRNASVSFEYNVQKWLGSLSSVGVSDSTIQQLAAGINYLGTGDLSSLSGNSQLQNLILMAAQLSGMDYGSILSSGLSSNDINSLMQGIVQLAQTIGSTDNLLVRSKYGEIFGLSSTDLAAIANLDTNTLNSILGTSLSFAQAEQEVNKQLGQLSSRLSISERIDNLFSNITNSIGENIANSAGTYATWLITNLIEDATGGIAIPTVGAFGNFIDLNATVTDLIKTGIVGVNTLGEIGTILTGLSGKNTLSLDNWGAKDYISRGWGFTGIQSTSGSSTTSGTMFIGNASGSDIYEQSIAGAKQEAQTVSGTEDSSAELTKAIDKSTQLSTIVKILDLWDRSGITVKLDSSQLMLLSNDY